MLALEKLIFKYFQMWLKIWSTNYAHISFKNLKIYAIANQNNYMSLYIMNYDLLENFKEELSGFNCEK